MRVGHTLMSLSIF